MSKFFGRLADGLNFKPRASDPSDGQAGDIYYNTTNNVFRFFNGTVWKTVGTGSGTGGINFVDNGDFENGVVNPFVTYADAAGPTPVDGTGGSPVSTLAINSSSPLSQQFDAIFSKDAANRQGEGWSDDVTIDNARAVKGTIIQVDLDYKVGGGFVTGPNSDIQMFIYDVTGAVLIPLDITAIMSAGVAHYRGKFVVQTTGNLIYRLIGHIATTNASAWTFEFDNVRMGPETVETAASSGDRQTEMAPGPSTNLVWTNTGSFSPISSTPTISFVAKATAIYRLYTGQTYGHNGTSAAVYVRWGAVSGSPVFITQNEPFTDLPGTSGFVNQFVEALVLLEAGQSYTFGFEGMVSSSNGEMLGDTALTLNAEQITPDRTTIGASDKVYLSQLITNGTLVTGVDPAKIGEYRAMSRSGGVLVDDTPTVPPNTTDGIRVYADVAGNLSSGTAGQITFYKAFIGFGKTIKSEVYAAAAKIGLVPEEFFFDGNTTDYGFGIEYNPNTGIIIFDANKTTSSGHTGRALGLYSGGGPTNGYWDVAISDNPLGLGSPTDNSAYVKDYKSAGTNGGTFTGGSFQTRDLNTVENQQSWIQLSSNQITLERGTYIIDAAASATNVNGHQAKLRNITESSDALTGTTEFSSAASNIMTKSLVCGRIAIASQKVFEIQHFGSTTVSSIGFGIGLGQAPELYTQVKITKLS